MFSKGTRVRCLDNTTDGSEEDLTVGKTYIVYDVVAKADVPRSTEDTKESTLLGLHDDVYYQSSISDGVLRQEWYYNASRFVVVSSIKNKLSKLLKEAQ